jgi:hypothetical protein
MDVENCCWADAAGRRRREEGVLDVENCCWAARWRGREDGAVDVERRREVLPRGVLNGYFSTI